MTKLVTRVLPYFPGTVVAGNGIGITQVGVAFTVSWNATGAGFSAFGLVLGGAASATAARVLLGSVPSVVTFGADPSGVADSTAAINNAIAANVAVYFPAGIYKISSPIVIPQGVTRHLRGSGQYATFILQTGNTSDGIQNLQTSAQGGGSIRGLSIHAGTALLQTGGFSSGVGINLKNINSAFVVDDVWVSNFATSYKDDGCFNLMLSNFNFLYFQSSGISVPVHTTGGA